MEMRTYFNCVQCALYMTVFASLIVGKPSSDQQEGPCVGMDCLHGVLMHNDDEQGETHKAEDQYLRFKSQLETEKPKPGPLDAEQTYHGALMHGDESTGITHNEDSEMKILPEIKGQAGPQEINEYVHELLHNEESNVKHKAGDTRDEGNLGKKGPMDGEELMHGVLMHGDPEQGKAHEHSSDESNNGTERTQAGPQDANEHMHGVLMHGDAEPGQSHDHAHVDNTADATSNQQAGPGNAEEQLHGVLMHGDEEPGKEHHHHENEESKDSTTIKRVGPSSDDLHGILMHGDSAAGHDHSEEDAKSASSGDVFSNLLDILDMDIDKDLLKIIDIEKILKEDQEEYKKWILEHPEFQDETMMGSSYASASDSLLDDIELVKKRYLQQDADDSVSGKAYESENGELPFTAEDAVENLKSSGMEHPDNDARHQLELLGSTDPINARHKAYVELMKSKDTE